MTLDEFQKLLDNIRDGWDHPDERPTLSGWYAAQLEKAFDAGRMAIKAKQELEAQVEELLGILGDKFLDQNVELPRILKIHNDVIAMNLEKVLHLAVVGRQAVISNPLRLLLAEFCKAIREGKYIPEAYKE